LTNEPFTRGIRSSSLALIGAFASAAFIGMKTKSLIATRLRLNAKLHGSTSGTYSFPFGRVRYVDAWGLDTMFNELFVSEVYGVKGMPEHPRIIDCGGNIGLSTIWFKLNYPSADLTVFEADPALADILEENVRNLGLQSVEIVKAAVSDRSGQARFARDRSLTGHIVLDENSDKELTIECVRLSDRLDKPVDLLKVDIEGSEFGLFKDLCQTGKIDLVRNVICEVHGNSRVQDQIHQLTSSWRQAGFKLTVGGAETNERLPGPPDPTPFSGLASGKFILFLYAWR
jgi:FkbM family methyltransferase